MSAFNTLLQTSRSRNFGGTSQTVACEPYISGYFFIKWYLPRTMSKFISKYVGNTQNDQTIFNNLTEAEDVLSAACTGVSSIPGQGLEFVEYEGSCGALWNNPFKVTNGHNISVKYTEMSGIPIYRIHKCWIDMIRDAHQGVDGSYEDVKGSDTIRDNWSGTLLYWTTKPDGCTIEYYAAYSGVVPERDSQENFATDVTSIDKVELDISYRLDYVWNDKWVYDTIKNISTTKPFGGTGGTLWSRDGFRNVNTLKQI